MTLQVSDFDYDLPESAIAQQAIDPRDSARLLVASTLDDRSITDLPGLLDPGDLVVVNETRVRPARIIAIKDSGGTVEILLTKRRDIATWDALLRPARRVRTGMKMTAGPLLITVLTDPVQGAATITVEGDGDTDDLLPGVGQIPLPPYFHGHLDDDERYQTIFAKTVGSAAAPTAALHFTPRLVAGLAERGVQIVAIDLEVGVDTFRPMGDGRVEDHLIHRERYSVPEAAARSVAETRSRGSRVVAIGTTVVRTLETVVDDQGMVHGGIGETDLFITPGHRFRSVDAMVTNFHAPRTTLLVMMAAVMGVRWRDVYEHALGADYRFLSFGDAMFTEVSR